MKNQAEQEKAAVLNAEIAKETESEIKKRMDSDLLKILLVLPGWCVGVLFLLLGGVFFETYIDSSPEIVIPGCIIFANACFFLFGYAGLKWIKKKDLFFDVLAMVVSMAGQTLLIVTVLRDNVQGWLVGCGFLLILALIIPYRVHRKLAQIFMLIGSLFALVMVLGWFISPSLVNGLK